MAIPSEAHANRGGPDFSGMASPTEATRIPMTQTGRSTPREDPNAVFQRAVSLHRSGELEEAIRLYRHLLDRFPRNPQTVFALGTAECQAGNAIDGIRLLDEFLSTFPNSAAAHKNRGMALSSIGRLEEAQDSYRRAIALDPDDAEARLRLADVLCDLGRLEEALLGYDRALPFAPEDADAHFQRGNVLRHLGRREEALESYARAVRINPGFMQAHRNRGALLCELGRADEGLHCLEQAIRLAPAAPDLHTYRGSALRNLGRFDEALQAYDAAVRASPDYADAHFQKAELMLLMGDYRRGWELYEWRWKTGLRKTRPTYEQFPLWTGDQPIAGRSILVCPEAGFGDFIMFSRYALSLGGLGARVVMHTPGPLVSLLASLGEQVAVVDESEPPPRVDWRCPIMSLPRAFATTLDSVPGDVPYLSVAEEKRTRWRQRLGRPERFRLGLMWSGQAGRILDQSVFRNRSVPIRLLQPLFDLPVEIHALQKEIPPDDAAFLSRLDRIVTHDRELADFADTAALVEQMDLIVSIDTSVAHLAGALARPLWVMLPHAVDYRWGPAGDRTPWYPTAMLFRQTAAGDWAAVVRAVRARLADLLQSARPDPRDTTSPGPAGPGAAGI